jgi:hypothetical protein
LQFHIREIHLSNFGTSKGDPLQFQIGEITGLQYALDEFVMNEFDAFEKIDTDDFTILKNDVLHPAPLKLNQAEIAIFESAAHKICLLPITPCKVAAIKQHLIKRALF